VLFDSHCHLTDERFAGDVDEVVARSRAAGVLRMVTIGAEPGEAEKACALARRLEGVWAAVGIHPHIAHQTDDVALSRIRDLAAGDEVVAIGETGLDYFYDHSPRDVQLRSFLRHLEMAEDLGLPLVVHSRQADEDTAAVLREAGHRVRGVLHCFGDGAPLLEAGLEADWFISYAGVVTFKKWGDAGLLRAVPRERLLVETDSPYLAPVPHRGRRNEPAFVRQVAEAVAVHRGEEFDEIARATCRNACDLYGLSEV